MYNKQTKHKRIYQGNNMKSIKLLISKNGFEILKILMEEWYLSECIANNCSEVDDMNIIKKPTMIQKVKGLIYFFKNNLESYDIKFLEMSLKELQERNDISYCYILEDNNKISMILENHISSEEFENLYQQENQFEMES